MMTKYFFKLFIKGRSILTDAAIENSRKICELTAGKDYRLSISDLNQNGTLDEHENILAVPLLMRTHPLPPVRVIGDLSETQEIAILFKAD